jgi:hypothetical protein
MIEKEFIFVTLNPDISKVKIFTEPFFWGEKVKIRESLPVCIRNVSFEAVLRIRIRIRIRRIRIFLGLLDPDLDPSFTKQK